MRLDLHDNPITADFAPALAALLASQAHLKALVLNDTCLGDEGVAEVCGALGAGGGAPQLEVSPGGEEVLHGRVCQAVPHRKVAPLKRLPLSSRCLPISSLLPMSALLLLHQPNHHHALPHLLTWLAGIGAGPE